MKVLAMIAAVAALTHGAPVAAQERTDARANDVQPTVPTALSADELASTRGGYTIILNNQSLSAVTSGNTISGGYVAGDISFNDAALSNFAGIGNFTINTGAQNNLQTAMILTINVAD